MRPGAVFILLSAFAGGCGDISPPTQDERAEARQQLLDVFETVDRSERQDDTVTALRWRIESPSFEQNRWQWREAEVVVAQSPAGSDAVTIQRSLSVDPSTLALDVPAAYAQDAWALELQCADAPCIRRREVATSITDGEKRETETTERLVSDHVLLFDTYPARDRAIALIRRALGAPPR